jgi:hypothetical protein
MYPGYALLLRGKLGASLEPLFLDLDSMMVSPGLAGTHVQPVLGKSSKAISFQLSALSGLS